MVSCYEQLAAFEQRCRCTFFLLGPPVVPFESVVLLDHSPAMTLHLLVQGFPKSSPASCYGLLGGIVWDDLARPNVHAMSGFEPLQHGRIFPPQHGLVEAVLPRLCRDGNT